MIRVNNIRLSLQEEPEKIEKKLLRMLKIAPQELQQWRMIRRSLDARKKEDIHYVYTVDVKLSDEKKVLAKIKGVQHSPDEAYHFPEGKAVCPKRPVVVGFGPAGMFAALLLAEMGLRPIVLERGGDVDSRQKAVEAFWQDGILDTENNVQFGEGGAGTFSDGKLTSRSKDRRSRKVLEELAAAGAPQEILYEQKPHVGTDRLREVVKCIREKIIALGGEVRFFAKVEQFEEKDGKLCAIRLADGTRIETCDAVLAIGHSARDTFSRLWESGIALEQKPFAMGVRIEHKQSWLNTAQYGDAAALLPPADYQLTYTTQEGRGVYSFCMCPGGYVVAAASEEGRLAVNGMSYHDRAGENANAALLVQVYPSDFGSDHPLAGMYWQRELEEKAFAAGGGYFAPVQSVGDFLAKGSGQLNEDGVQPTYRPGVKAVDLRTVLPDFMCDALAEAIPVMGRKLKGFDAPQAVMTAVESRSSSPIRILRDERGQSLSMEGLYPTGEGAGYAGGIVSAAIDGIKAAEHIFGRYRIPDDSLERY